MESRVSAKLLFIGGRSAGGLLRSRDYAFTTEGPAKSLEPRSMWYMLNRF